MARRCPPARRFSPATSSVLGEASTAALRFGDSLVLAAPLTELVIESEGVTLRNGRLQVRADGAESFAISGPFFHVNIAASEGIPSSAEIRLGGMRAQVSAVAGAADLTAAGSAAPYKLHAGETATLDACGRRRLSRPRRLPAQKRAKFPASSRKCRSTGLAGSRCCGFRSHLLE